MQVELKMNDKSIQAEISEEQLKELGLVEDKPKTGYERVDEDESYFVDDTINDGHEVLGGRTLVNNLYYINGNYYNDKSIVENNARADRLLRRLRQWQAQNDEVISKEDWEDQDLKKYSIIYDYSSNVFYAGRTWWMRGPNNIYFKSREKAEEAIEVFKDELLWYFTEYVQRLDEVQNG
jgi:hypothetical protein